MYTNCWHSDDFVGFDVAKRSVNPRLTSDPCALAKVVGMACDTGFLIPTAGRNQTYSGVRADAQTPCICSTVYYTLLVVCAMCEDAGTLSWEVYSSNCTDTYTGWNNFSSLGIDSTTGSLSSYWINGMEVNVLQNNGFVDLQAIKTDSLPDVMLGNQTSISGTGTVSESPPQTSSETPSLNTSKHGPSPAIIAGGVAEGAVFVLLVISFVLWRRRRKSRSQSRPTTPIDPLRNQKDSVQRDANQASQTERQESRRVSDLQILIVDPCSDNSGSQERSSSMQRQSMDESRNESRTDSPQQVPEPGVIDQSQIVMAQDPEAHLSLELNEETEVMFSELQYRAMQARMDRLVAGIDEISRFVHPPAYHS
ncbi:hypothetical protein K435DRAFT_873160 [Dendrothele bispora CBS 962.96]|uniref:Uncharacterized protein n=1 Tax=Dendrothele bispora (strain CBS 962.96) TaxID=1314807 RepID=A0A4S8L014_DENBC|nr:hypothetical protein K435DRAFT_873160 [Dendrothele bispora CBS 962.96]